MQPLPPARADDAPTRGGAAGAASLPRAYASEQRALPSSRAMGGHNPSGSHSYWQGVGPSESAPQRTAWIGRVCERIANPRLKPGVRPLTLDQFVCWRS